MDGKNIDRHKRISRKPIGADSDSDILKSGRGEKVIAQGLTSSRARRHGEGWARMGAYDPATASWRL